MKKLTKLLLIILIVFLFDLNVSAADTRHVYNENYSLETINYSEGLYPVKDRTTQRFGAMDTYGNIIIPCEYKLVGDFSDGLATVVTVDGEVYLINSKNERVYNGGGVYKKHGDFGIIVKTTGKEQVVLVDKNYQKTVDKTLEVIKNGEYWYFTSDDGNVYNYRGEDLTEKILKECPRKYELFTCGKYLAVMYSESQESMTSIFDVNGNKKVTFKGTSYSNSMYKNNMNSNFIIHNPPWDDFAVYNTEGKELIRIAGINNGGRGGSAEIIGNYVSVKKVGGTAAVMDKDGNMIVDFGKWDYVLPTLNKDVFLVAVGSNCGLANKNGDLLLPLEYSSGDFFHLIQDNGKYVCLTDMNRVKHTINTLTLKEVTASINVSNGAKYLAYNHEILNDNFENQATNYRLSPHFLLDGIVNNTQSIDLIDWTVFNDNGGIKVKIDYEYLTFEHYPEVINGRTLVPLRKIFETIGAEVIWNDSDQSIIATKGDINIKMQIESNILVKNGQPSEMDVCPQLIDGFTLVPVRAISDCFNISVDWNESANTVSLFTD